MTEEHVVTPAAKTPLLHRVLPLLILGAGLAGFFALGLNKYVSLDLLKEHRGALLEWVAAHKTEAVLSFIVIYAVAVAFSLPIAAVLSVTGGFLFGTVFGAAWIVIGATIGAVAVFLAARYAFSGVLSQWFGSRFKALEEGFRAGAFNYLLVLRLVPLFPFWLVNLAPAFLGVKTGTFIAATFIGIIPGALVYASVGTGLNALFEAGESPDFGIILKPEFLVPIVGLAVLALVPVIYRAFTTKPAKN